MAEDKKAKLSFYQKQDTRCPVCDNTFRKEELLSGGGRMNAGDLTKELHREYRPTEKFGKVYPLLYPVTVCPSCFYAAYGSDFAKPSGERVNKLKEEIGERKAVVKKIFPSLDFQLNRGLSEGIASYILGMMSYDSAPVDCAPHFKTGSLLSACLLALYGLSPGGTRRELRLPGSGFLPESRLLLQQGD